jgi:hypothetical protein
MNRELRRQKKDIEVGQATRTIKQQSALVKRLTKEVKKGLASRKELEDAVADLDKIGRSVEMLSAESRMLSEWTLASDNEVLPKEQSPLPYLLAAALILWACTRSWQ